MVDCDSITWRLLYPAMLIICAISSINILSSVYLYFFLLMMILDSYSILNTTILGFLFAYSITYVSSHFIYTVVSHFLPERLFFKCNSTGFILNELGIFNLELNPKITSLRILFPYIIFSLVTLILFIMRLHNRFMIKTFSGGTTNMSNSKIGSTNYSSEKPSIRLFKINSHDTSMNIRLKTKIWSTWMLEKMKILLNLILLGTCAIITPSLINLTYYIIFLVFCFLWSIGQINKSKNLLYFRTFVLIYSGLHMTLLYNFQVETFYNFLEYKPHTNTILGLYTYVNNSCKQTDKYQVFINKHPRQYLCPLFLVLLYYLNALNVKTWLDYDTIHNLTILPSFSRRRHNNYSSTNINERSNERPFISDLLIAIVRNSYVLCLIAMMAWSISYKSWLTFFYLVTACILWLMPDTRKACLFSSPFIVTYAMFLNILTYLFLIYPIMMETLNTELFRFKPLGIFNTDLPVYSLFFTTAYLLVFFMTLKLYFTEYNIFGNLKHEVPKVSKFKENALYAMFRSSISSIFENYWIVMCATALLFAGAQKDVKILSLVYLVLYIYFIMTLMLNYKFWRSQLFVFWWFVVFYSLTSIFMIYTYQFNTFNYLWALLFRTDMLIKLGLYRSKDRTLFDLLFMHVFQLIISIIQVRYFHYNFLNKTKIVYRTPSDISYKSAISAYDPPSFYNALSLLASSFKTNKKHDKIHEMSNIWLLIFHGLSKELSKLSVFLWRVAEVHFIKIVVIMLSASCLENLCLYNFFVLFIVIVVYPFSVKYKNLIIIMFILSSIHLLAHNLFQLSKLNNYFRIFKDCQRSEIQNLTIVSTMMRKYFGLYYTNNVFGENKFLIATLMGCNLWFLIYYHQKRINAYSNLKITTNTLIFQNFKVDDFNRSFSSGFKYICNYTFFRLGLEISLIAIVINACVRLDILSILYLLMLFVFLLSSRIFIAKLWIAYLCFLCAIIPVQYIVALGIFDIFCVEYTFKSLDRFTTQLFYLPHYVHQPPAWKIYGDIIQFMISLSQMKVFIMELTEYSKLASLNYPLVNNELPDIEDKDFITSKDTYMDYMFHFAFQGVYWVCLVTMVFTGLSRKTIICLGYLIIAIIYFWIGRKLMFKSRRYLLYSWGFILGFNYVAIFVKCILQFVGCLYVSKTYTNVNCLIVRLFGIQCYDPYDNSDVYNKFREDCHFEEGVFVFDVLCFILVIIQRKIFRSDSFSFVILDKKVSRAFASRGGYLISRKLMSVLIRERLKENHVINNIRLNIHNIELKHIDYGRPLPNDHYLLLRSGDYFLFEEKSKYDSTEDTYSHIPKSSRNQKSEMSSSFRDRYGSVKSCLGPSYKAVDYHGVNPSVIPKYSRNSLVEQHLQTIKKCTKESIHESSKSTPDNIHESTTAESSEPLTPNIQENSTKDKKSNTSSDSTEKSKGKKSELFRKSLRLLQNPIKFSKSEASTKSINIHLIPVSKQKTDTSSFEIKKNKLIKRKKKLSIKDQKESVNTITRDDSSGQRTVTPTTMGSPVAGLTITRRLSKMLYSTKSKDANQNNINDSPDNENIKTFTRRLSKMLYSTKSKDTNQNNINDSPDDEEIKKIPKKVLQRTSSLTSPSDTFVTAMSISRDSLSIDKSTLDIEKTSQNFPFDEKTRIKKSSLKGRGSGSNLQSKANAMAAMFNYKRNRFHKKSMTSLKTNSHKNSIQTHYRKTSKDLSTMKEYISGMEVQARHRKKYQELERGNSEAVQPSGSAEIEEKSCIEKMRYLVKQLRHLIDKGLKLLTKKINTITRDMRFVRKIVNGEKLIIKMRILTFASGSWLGRTDDTFNVVTNEGDQALLINTSISAKIYSSYDKWQTKYRGKKLESVSLKIFEKVDNESELQDETSPVLNNSSFDGVTTKSIQSNTNAIFNEKLHKQKQFYRSSHILFRLGMAITNFIIIQSDLVCYTVMVLNHMIFASIFTMVYPLSVFLWAMLSVPRPSTLYWLCMIIYTELIILVKYIFQFKVNNFDHMIKVKTEINVTEFLGLHDNSVMDLLLLLVLFLHRDYLKSHGLWKTVSYDRTENIDSFFMRILKLFKTFFLNLWSSHHSKKVDVYTYTFSCEFISFLLIFFGFTFLGFSLDIKNEPGRNNELKSGLDFIRTNKIPVAFVALLMVQFTCIVIDRILFLRKQVIGKLIFLVLHVLVVHIWLFMVIPLYSVQKFHLYMLPQFFYFFKCVYFALSAYQVKCGYPLRILGNFLTKNYNYINLFLFKGYLLVPFLYELRNIMDWMFTDTSLSLFHWMEVEDVFTKIFALKCWRRSEIEYPIKRGEKMPYYLKYLIGSLLMLVFMVCLWGPLLLGSAIITTYKSNTPNSCKLTISIGDFQPVFEFASSGLTLEKYSYNEFLTIKDCCFYYKVSESFFREFDHEDVVKMKIHPFSLSYWGITNHNLNILKNLLSDGTKIVDIKIYIKCHRNVDLSYRSEVLYSRSILMNKYIQFHMYNLLNGSLKQIYLSNILPKYLRASSYRLFEMFQEEFCGATQYTSIVMKFENDSNILTWSISEQASRGCFSQNYPENDNIVYIFSDRIPSNFIGNIFQQYGILGMYAAYIFVVHRLLRAIYFDLSYLIDKNELPNVDRIMNLLKDIYLVRENKMFLLEEQLVAKLIFLFRSSETLIKFTRHSKKVVNKFMDN